MEKSSIFAIRGDKRFAIAFLVLFAVIVIAMGYIFRYFFWPFLFALVCYVALKPFHDLLCRHIKRRWLSTTIVISLFVLLIIIPFLFLLIALADQTFQFYQMIASKVVLKNIQNYIYGDDRLIVLLKTINISRAEVIHKIMAMLENVSFDLFSNITSMVGVSLQFLVNFFFMILMLFAVFTEGKKLTDLVYNVIPFPKAIEKNILTRLRQVIRILIAGNIAIMALQGVALGAGFYIFDVGMPILAGCISGLFSLIPVVGTSFVWLPAVAYYIIVGKYSTAVMLGLWCVVWYLILENLVKPKVFGDKLNFHPLVFFFLIIGSIGVFNLPGIIVGPILLTIFFSLWEIYSFLYLEDEVLYEKVKSNSRSRKSRAKP